MAAVTRVGGEVDAFCNRCKLTLAHTILAMVGAKVVRVQCNTCHGQHAFRGAGAPTPSVRTSVRAPKAAEPAPEKTVTSFEALLAAKDLAQARPYSPRNTYKVEDVLQHPTFGYGIVSTVRADKVDVNFKFYVKTLVHGRGEAPVTRPAAPEGAARGASASDQDGATTSEAEGNPAEPTVG